MSQSTSFWDHPIEKLEEALSIRKQIAALQSKLSSLFGSEEAKPKGAKPVSKPRGKRTVSPETRAKMVAAQQARFAKKADVAPTVLEKAVKAPKKRGALSAEGRAKLSAAMKARWADRAKGVAAPNAKKATTTSSPKRKKRTVSPETRARLTEAARLRWAKLKSDQ